MLTKERVIEILRGQTGSISFNFTAPSGIQVTVAPVTFTNVASAISDGRIELNFNPRHRMRGAFASYHGANRTVTGQHTHSFISGVLILRREDNPAGRAAVIHEAVHASFDLTHSCFSSLENEAAAYIADSLFFKSLYGSSYTNNETNAGAQHLLDIAKQIADNLPPNGTVSTGEIKNLINALYQVPFYHRRTDYLYACDG